MKKKAEIFFGTKEENNMRRLNEALSRTPHERLIYFLKLCEEMQFFHTNQAHPNDSKNNFILQ
ncbi:hypothetical protein MASR2M47_26240 [Draconibacterium sp.]|jgi:hypothetical protein